MRSNKNITARDRISHFCESGEGLRMHDGEAPTMQNAMCNRQPALDVILSNDDFKELAAPNLSKHIAVTFEETQEGDEPRKVVLALDTSSSMALKDWIRVLQEGLLTYINNIPDGKIRLAMLEFSTTAALLHDVLLVNSSTRQGFVDAVNDLTPTNNTCIGCALELALQVLTKTSDPAYGSIIVVVTDGEENVKPFMTSVIPSLVSSFVEVSTFALGTDADPKLEQLADATNGRAFFFPDDQKFTAVNMGMAFQTVSTPVMADSAWPITVFQDERKFTNKMQLDFTIDVGLAKNTTVIATVGAFDPSMRMWLVGPDGWQCENCTTAINNVTKITIPDPVHPGTWTLRVDRTSTDPIDIHVRVISQPEDNNTEPILATCRMTKMASTNKFDVVVVVDVTKGQQIVLNATAVAHITDPHGKLTTLTLLDNGKDPDVYPDDGKYSGYYTKFDGKGRYVVKARVKGNGARKACCATCSGSTITPSRLLTLPPGNCNPDYGYDIGCFGSTNKSFEKAPRPKGKPTGPFHRQIEGLSFDVIDDLQEHMVPPVEMRDLKVSHAGQGENGSLLVNMTWTWPGKHMNHGNASSIDIRASKDFKSLQDDFESQVQIDSTSLVQGDLEPRPGGTTNAVTISLSREWAKETPNFTMWRVKFAARVNNSYGLMSGISNIAQLDYDDWSKSAAGYHGNKYTSKVPEGLPARPTTAGKSSPKSTQGNSADDENNDDKSSASLIPWLLALLAAAVMVGSAALWILKRSKVGSDIGVGEKGVTEVAETTSAPP